MHEVGYKIYSSSSLIPATCISDLQQGCNPGSVRLVNSSANAVFNRIQGIVELCLDGNWNRICNENWDYRDAAVTCNQLGLPSHGKICNALQKIFHPYIIIIMNCRQSVYLPQAGWFTIIIGSKNWWYIVGYKVKPGVLSAKSRRCTGFGVC